MSVVERIVKAIAVNRYLREQKELRLQERATTDPKLRAQIKSQMRDIDHQMTTIRGETAEVAQHLVREGDELLTQSGKQLTGSKWATGVASALALAGAGWALYERNRRVKAQPSQEQQSALTR